jgi:hypothetical protein
MLPARSFQGPHTAQLVTPVTHDLRIQLAGQVGERDEARH